MFLRNHTFLAVLIVFTLVFLVACGSREEGCPAAGCATGEVCIAARCRDGAVDHDGDGLVSALEVQWGLSPVVADSDDDGLPDGMEFGPTSTPRDSDGDGAIDALESALVDTDGDCIPDQLDAADGVVGLLSSIRPAICPALGLCQEHFDLLEVACVDGTPVCFMDGLKDYEYFEFSCDGLDNDCDGLTDEGITLGSAFPGEACSAPGVCGGGTVECNPETGMAVCSSASGGSGSKASPEVCDGLDNDCNGIVDEDMSWEEVPLGEPCDAFGLCSKGVVECHPTAGEAICSTMHGGSDDESKVEICDGLDNDCDGEADEELTSPDLGKCPDEGVCAGQSELLKVVCNQGEWVCDPTAIEEYQFGDEFLCDGLDNDCDGLTDENFQITAYDGLKKAVLSACGTGPCAGGKVVCAEDGFEAVCSTWTNREDERCDDLDNDCDGEVDEDQEYAEVPLGESCKGAGICGVGTVECNGKTGLATCSTNPDGSGSEAVPESCDGLDNDCDGSTDEGIEASSTCVKAGVCEAFEPEAQCVYGDWTCDYSFVPEWEVAEESCDQLDNDCDGWVDESLAKEFSAAAVVVLDDLPPVRQGAAYCVAPSLGGLYLSSGMSHSFPFDGTDSCLPDLWFYELETRRWSPLPAGPVAPRRDHVLLFDPAQEALLTIGGRCVDTQATVWRHHLASGEYENVMVPGKVADRWGHAAFLSYDLGEVLVLGGRNSDGFADSYRLSSDLTAATLIPEGPRMIHAASCDVSGENVGYLFGGEQEDGTLSGRLLIVDLVTGDIEVVEGGFSPEPRRKASLACGDGEVFLFGGEGDDGEFLNDAWVYDTAQGIWSHGSAQPPARAEALLARTDGVVHLQGGIDAAGRGLPDGWVYEDEKWTELPRTHPGNIAGAAYALDPVAGRACLVGGFETGSLALHPQMNMWCMDLASGEWGTLGPPLTEPVILAAMTFDPNSYRFVLVGGALFPAGQEPQPLSPLCRYRAFDIATQEWGDLDGCPGGPGPGALSGHAAAVRWKDLTMWVYGGIGSNGVSNELWRVGLDTWQWELVEVQGPASLPARYGHRMWMREKQGELLVLGSAGNSGAAFLVDLTTLSVIELVSVPGWLDFGFASLFYDSDSQVALFLQPDKLSGTQLSFADSQLNDGQFLTFSHAADATALSSVFFDPWQRRGLRVGGICPHGLTRGAVVSFDMTCP